MGTNQNPAQPPQSAAPSCTEVTLARATKKIRNWWPFYVVCDVPLAVLALVLGLFAAGLAGSMATPKGDAIRGWFGGWEKLCGFVAGVGFVATVLNGAHKLADFTGRRKQAAKCSSELQAIALDRSTLAPDDLTAKVKKVVLDHSELLAGVEVPLETT